MDVAEQFFTPEHLIEQIVTIAQGNYAQLGRGCSVREYAYALGEALHERSLAFVELAPGTLVIEQRVAVMMGRSTEDLRTFLGLFGVGTGVWLDFDGDALGVERVWLWM